MSILKGSNLILNSLLGRKTLIPSSVFQLDRYNYTKMRMRERKELPPNIQEIIKPLKDLQDLWDHKSKYEEKLFFYSDSLPPLDDIYKTSDNQFKSPCGEVWVRAYLDPDNKAWFQVDSDSEYFEYHMGYLSILSKGLSGRPVTELTPDLFNLIHQTLREGGSLPYNLFYMLEIMKRKCLYLAADYVKEKELKLKELAQERQQIDDFIKGWREHAAATAGGFGGLSRKWRIEEMLDMEFGPVEMEVEEHSHLNVRIVSEEFKGKTIAERHSMVYAVLQDALETPFPPFSVSIVAKASRGESLLTGKRHTGE